jgi:hypothetical protein
MESPESGSRMLPLPDAAVRLRLTWSQIYAALLSGRLQGERRGRRWFVSEASIERVEQDCLGSTRPVECADDHQRRLG